MAKFGQCPRSVKPCSQCECRYMMASEFLMGIFKDLVCRLCSVGSEIGCYADIVLVLTSGLDGRVLFCGPISKRTDYLSMECLSEIAYIKAYRSINRTDHSVDLHRWCVDVLLSIIEFLWDNRLWMVIPSDNGEVDCT